MYCTAWQEELNILERCEMCNMKFVLHSMARSMNILERCEMCNMKYVLHSMARRIEYIGEV